MGPRVRPTPRPPQGSSQWGQIKADSGLALRFPRFTGRWRDDKAPEDAATAAELVAMYRSAWLGGFDLAKLRGRR